MSVQQNINLLYLHKTEKNDWISDCMSSCFNTI